MGQKVHPTGFRTGINQPHASTWFANYGAYSQVLNEDYLIRQFFEKEFEPIYGKAGITTFRPGIALNIFSRLCPCSGP